jgi:radial spoke head protein 4A
MTFEEAKQVLLKEEAGINLHEHLTNAVLKLCLEQPSDAHAVFEDLSSQVKQSTFVQQSAAQGGGIITPGEAVGSKANAAQLGWSKAAGALFDGAPTVHTQDLPDEASMLEWACVGFGKSETYRLHLSIQKLAAQTKAANMRLWGKITGTQSDYYVAEGEVNDPTTPADPRVEEPRITLGNPAKTGNDTTANKFTYWVCSNSAGNWARLPDVKAHEILAAQKLKKYFTGDLSAPVVSYPPFPGDESNLLRAQIARIAAATVIVPTGIFATCEFTSEWGAETGIERVEEEGDAMSVSDLLSMNNWQHLNLEVNSRGRCRKTWDGDNEKWEEEDYPEEKPPLCVVADDEGAETRWRTRVINQLAVVRSLAWPGAYAIGFGRKYTNIYVGYGCKYSPGPYTPPAPPKLQSEFELAEDAGEDAWDGDREEADVAVDPTLPEEDENDAE